MRPDTASAEGTFNPGIEGGPTTERFATGWDKIDHDDRYFWNPEVVKKPIELSGVQSETQPDRQKAYEELVLWLSKQDKDRLESGDLPSELTYILDKYKIYDEGLLSGISRFAKETHVLSPLLNQMINKSNGLDKTGKRKTVDFEAIVIGIKIVDGHVRVLGSDDNAPQTIDRLIALADLLLPEYNYQRPGESVEYIEKGDNTDEGEPTEALLSQTSVMPATEQEALKSPELSRRGRIAEGFAKFFKTMREWTTDKVLPGIEQFARERIARFGEQRKQRVRVRQERRRAEDNILAASLVVDQLSDMMAFKIDDVPYELIIKQSLGLEEGTGNTQVVNELERLIRGVNKQKYVGWIDVVGPLDNALAYMQGLETVEIPKVVKGSPTA